MKTISLIGAICISSTSGVVIRDDPPMNWMNRTTPQGVLPMKPITQSSIVTDTFKKGDSPIKASTPKGEGEGPTPEY